MFFRNNFCSNIHLYTNFVLATMELFTSFFFFLESICYLHHCEARFTFPRNIICTHFKAQAYKVSTSPLEISRSEASLGAFLTDLQLNTLKTPYEFGVLDLGVRDSPIHVPEKGHQAHKYVQLINAIKNTEHAKKSLQVQKKNT